MSEQVRAFFAVALPEEARRAAAELARRLREAERGEGVRWVRPESYHLTLRFLGNLAREAIAELSERVALEVSSLAPFEVHLVGARVFPSPRSPRVITVAVEPEAPLACLAAGVEQGVVAAGQKPERRRFRAHLTLGRVRNRRFPSVDEVAAIEGPAFAVEEVVLFQSELHRSGAVYTPLERIALRGQSPGESPRSQTETSPGGLPRRDAARTESP